MPRIVPVGTSISTRSFGFAMIAGFAGGFGSASGGMAAFGGGRSFAPVVGLSFLSSRLGSGRGGGSDGAVGRVSAAVARVSAAVGWAAATRDEAEVAVA